LRTPPLETTKAEVERALLTTPLVAANTTEPKGQTAASKGNALGHKPTVRCLKTSVPAVQAPGALPVVIF
jgi:hypothetical protein